MSRKFGEQTHEELVEARSVASSAVEVYGDCPNEAVWRHFREHGIWNDHAAVQAALRVIMNRNDSIDRLKIQWQAEGIMKSAGIVRDMVEVNRKRVASALENAADEYRRQAREAQ